MTVLFPEYSMPTAVPGCRWLYLLKQRMDVLTYLRQFLESLFLPDKYPPREVLNNNILSVMHVSPHFSEQYSSNCLSCSGGSGIWGLRTILQPVWSWSSISSEPEFLDLPQVCHGLILLVSSLWNWDNMSFIGSFRNNKPRVWVRRSDGWRNCTGQQL